MPSWWFRVLTLTSEMFQSVCAAACNIELGIGSTFLGLNSKYFFCHNVSNSPTCHSIVRRERQKCCLRTMIFGEKSVLGKITGSRSLQESGTKQMLDFLFYSDILHKIIATLF